MDGQDDNKDFFQTYERVFCSDMTELQRHFEMLLRKRLVSHCKNEPLGRSGFFGKCAMFMECFGGDSPVPPILRLFLINTFWKIAEGESADKVFMLKKKKGRPKERLISRNMEITVEVRKCMKNGSTLEKASVEISNEYNLSEESILKIYKENINSIKLMYQDDVTADDPLGIYLANNCGLPSVDEVFTKEEIEEFKREVESQTNHDDGGKEG